jgi:hypothetical protein
VTETEEEAVFVTFEQVMVKLYVTGSDPLEYKGPSQLESDDDLEPLKPPGPEAVHDSAFCEFQVIRTVLPLETLREPQPSSRRTPFRPSICVVTTTPGVWHWCPLVHWAGDVHE